MDGLKQQKCVVSQFWRAAVGGRGVGRVGSFRGCEGGSVPGLSLGFWWLLALFGTLCLYKHHLNLCLHHHTTFSLCAHLSLCPNIPHLSGHQSHWIGDHPDDLILT